MVSWELEQETSEDPAGVGVVEEPAARPQGSSAVREASWVVGEHAEVLVGCGVAVGSGGGVAGRLEGWERWVVVVALLVATQGVGEDLAESLVGAQLEATAPLEADDQATVAR